MNEKNKLTEAEFFFGKMAQVDGAPNDFSHYLSAFLSAARSVLQYALEEAKTKPGGQRWYDAQTAGDTVLRFFKDKRDVNIHVKPLVLMQQTVITEKVSLTISESLHIDVRSAEGSVEVHEIKSEPVVPAMQQSHSSVKEQFAFVDWSGSGDVMAVGQTYLTRLKAFVQSGTGAGFISG